MFLTAGGKQSISGGHKKGSETQLNSINSDRVETGVVMNKFASSPSCNIEKISAGKGKEPCGLTLGNTMKFNTIWVQWYKVS